MITQIFPVLHTLPVLSIWIHEKKDNQEDWIVARILYLAPTFIISTPSHVTIGLSFEECVGRSLPYMHLSNSSGVIDKAWASSFSMKATAQHCKWTTDTREKQELSLQKIKCATYQICEIIASLSRHDFTGVTEPHNVSMDRKN